MINVVTYRNTCAVHICNSIHYIVSHRIRLSAISSVVGITCHKLSLRDESEVYDFADAIGTPFSLKIDDMTLKRGIIGLRHRDTTVHEFMHISGVTETLTKVLYS